MGAPSKPSEAGELATAQMSLGPQPAIPVKIIRRQTALGTRSNGLQAVIRPKCGAVKLIQEDVGEMTKSNRFLLAGAAIAGLLAGTAATIQASNLTNASAQDDSSAKADKKVKEKHACKGQNSCKGKGGCATDGSKMPS